MNPMKTVAAMIVILWVPIILPAQDKKAANLAAAPPNVAMFVHQEFFLGKAADRQKLESTISRACDRVDVPRYWIDLESISGEPEALVFSSYDSYEEMEQSDVDWRRFLIMHPDLERTKEEVEALAASERKTIAVRRDDLGYLSENIDLSEARFIHILEVRLSQDTKAILPKPTGSWPTRTPESKRTILGWCTKLMRARRRRPFWFCGRCRSSNNRMTSCLATRASSRRKVNKALKR